MKLLRIIKPKTLDFRKLIVIKGIIVLLIFISVMSLHAKVNITLPKVNIQNYQNNKNHTISGTVIDTMGEPLSGAYIVEKGTDNGTTTDIVGKFSITVSNSNAILVISFIGFSTQEVVVNGKTAITIKLVVSAALEEVVVVGYGTQKKSHITGSIASVPAKELQALPISRVDQALQGRISGVNIQNNDASPNSSVSIRIRGSNSINGGNNPLIIIDGFQGGSLDTINPNDIKSIEVLKDAAATAIYGSRGANGVILISTKTGKNQKLTVSYNSYVSVHNVRKKLDLLSPSEYAATVNANRTEFGLSPVFTSTDLAELTSGKGTDWQDAIFRTAIAQNHNLSVSGGSDRFAYFVSGDYLDNEGIVDGSSYNRFSLRANIGADINEKLKLKTNVFLNREADHTTTLNSFGGNNAGSPIFSALVFSPTLPVFDANGKYTQPAANFGPPTNYNPVALAKEPIRDYISNTSSINLGLNYDVIEGLKVNIIGGYRLIDREKSEFINSKPTGGATLNNAYIFNSRTMTLQNTNLISYNMKYNDMHDFKITAVVEQQYEEYNRNTASTQDFFTNLSYDNLQIGNNAQVPTSKREKKSLLSYLGRINYGYKNRYLLETIVRADGSSVFGAGNKWGYFPSGSLGWNVSNEEFLKNYETISNLKLRLSYGITGNQAIDPYQSLTRLNTGASYPINGAALSTGVSLGGIANPDLKWEETSQFNVGIDLKLFGGRVDIVADYYKKNTKDLLLNIPIPQASGGSGTVLRNVGEVQNKGFELYLGFTLVENDNFIWQSALTYAKNDNEVIALNGDDTKIPLGDAGLPGFTETVWIEVGQPLGTFRGYDYAGVWTTAEATEAASIKGVGGAYFPGAPKFVNQNNDNVIDDKDIVNIGNAQPDFTYGLNNSFSYKNFDLNIFIQGVNGNDIYNLGRVRTEITSGDADATSKVILNRWSTENENTKIPSFTGSKTFPTLQSSRWIEDGSYIRVKNISLIYHLPKSITEKLFINSLKIYVTGTNLFTITNYTGFDPESSTDVDSRAGIDIASYPSQKVFTFGLDVKF